MSTILFAYKFIKLERFNNKDYKKKSHCGDIETVPNREYNFRYLYTTSKPLLR